MCIGGTAVGRLLNQLGARRKRVSKLLFVQIFYRPVLFVSFYLFVYFVFVSLERRGANDGE